MPVAAHTSSLSTNGISNIRPAYRLRLGLTREKPSAAAPSIFAPAREGGSLMHLLWRS